MSHKEPCGSVTLDGRKGGDFRTNRGQARFRGQRIGVRIGEPGFLAPLLPGHLARPNALEFRRADGSCRGSWRHKVAGTVLVGETIDCTDPAAVARLGGWAKICRSAGFDPARWSKTAPPTKKEKEEGKTTGRPRFFTVYTDAGPTHRTLGSPPPLLRRQRVCDGASSYQSVLGSSASSSDTSRREDVVLQGECAARAAFCQQF